MIVMFQWEDGPVEYVTLDQAATKAGISERWLNQELRRKFVYRKRLFTIYTRGGAKAEGKGWKP